MAEQVLSPEVLHTRIKTNPDPEDPDDEDDLELNVHGGNGPAVPRWTLWPGKNKFYCGGRLFAGPERTPFLVTCSLISVPTLLFVLFVCPGLMKYNGGFVWCVVMSLVGLVSMIGSLTTCHMTDPGVIPREATPAHRPPRIQNKKLADNSIERWRWCDTCNVYRPPRCHHCSDCDNCVEGFDHHCPWVGNCIAARNYKFFFLFLLSTSCMLMFVFSFSCYYFTEVRNSEADKLTSTVASAPVALGLMIYCGVVFLPVFCLLAYHMNIISSGQTTKEEVKKLHQGSVNVNDHGCLRNWQLTLCGTTMASKLPDMQEIVSQTSWAGDDDEDLELGSSDTADANPVSVEMDTLHNSPPPYGDRTETPEVSVEPMKSPSSTPSLKSPSSADVPNATKRLQGGDTASGVTLESEPKADQPPS